MKRIAEVIETNELCKYGCGQVAKYRNGQGNLMCCKSSNSCPENKKKNSRGLKVAYDGGSRASGTENYKNLPQETKDRMSWSRGKTKETDGRIGNGTTGWKFPGRKVSDVTKIKLRNSRIKTLLEGNFDSSGRKGHRGHYDDMFFHSSWELAFYVYNKEMLNIQMKKNNSQSIEYIFANETHKYIPDFIDENGNMYEIKGYLFSEKDISKYEQTKNNVKYYFEESLRPMINHMIKNYGNKFWENFYNVPVVQ